MKNMIKGASVPIRTWYFYCLKNKQYWPLERIIRYQEKKLRKTVRYCWDYVPFYRTIWEKSISGPEEINSIKDLEKLPVISKTDILNNYADMLSRKKLVFSKESRTGGSTGQPLKFQMTRLDEEISWAQMYVGWSRADYNIGDAFLVIGGESIGVGLSDKRTWRDRLLNRWVTSGSNITRERVIALSKTRYFNQIKMIYGYPTAIREMCEHFHDLDIRPPHVKGVVCTAEPLRPEVRHRIKEILGIKNVLDQWGLNDGGLHAAEGVEQDGLHVSFYRGILEITDEKNRQIYDIGKTGKGVGTTFYNSAMPFIRYDTGDMLHWKSFQQSGTGITWPRIGPVDGRTGDVIYLKNKSITMPGLTLIMRWIEGLLEYQFIQTGPNHITVNLKKGKDFKLTEAETKAYLKSKIDDQVNWTIQWKEAERTANDKILIVRNDWFRNQNRPL